MIHGKHTVNVGFEFYNYRTNILYVGNSGLAGEFQYNGSFTGNPVGRPAQLAPAGQKPTSCWVYLRTSAWALAAVAVCTTACILRSLRTTGIFAPT